MALVRGLGPYVSEDDGPGAASLLRPTAGDWFRYGHVEAVRLALGVPDGTVEVPAVTAESLHHKASRALSLALHGVPDVDAQVRDDGSGLRITLQGNDFAVGTVTARLLVALWSEDLEGAVERDVSAPAGATAVSVAERA